MGKGVGGHYAARVLVGRAVERARLNRLVADAKDGRSRSLVLRGEAGIGKTALLDYAEGVAAGMRVIRVVGIENESEIPFAALQLMFGRFAAEIDALPGPQAEAMRTAMGAGTTQSDRILVGAATLTLLSELAGDQPLLCLCDDVQWFDSASAEALLFAVRRLHTDAVGTVFAVRDGERAFAPAGLESVQLARLDHDAAKELLATITTLPYEVAERVLADSAGNPLAIVELAPTTDKLPAPIAPMPAAGRLDEHFRRQLEDLPERTRQALLIAAADDGTAWADAASRQGLGAHDLEPAERARLVRVGTDGVTFRHPLIRAAAYQHAPYAQRIAAHAAHAEALTDPRDSDRRAWHLAAAATGTDDEVAAELDGAAQKALDRGGPAAAARAWERAAQLSGNRHRRASRLVAAARAAYDAGQFQRADELAAAGATLTVRLGDAAEAGWVRAQVAYERRSPAEASALSLSAAKPILQTDPARAVAMLTEATWCARDAADLTLLRQCADRARTLRGRSARLADALVAFADLLSGDVEAAVAPMRTLLAAGNDIEQSLGRMLAGFLGVLIGADAEATKVLEAQVAEFRDAGAVGWLPYANEPIALAQLVGGRFLDAEASVTEAIELGTELGQDLQVVVLTSISAWLAAVRGDPDTARHQAKLVLDDRRQHRMSAAQAHWALALVDLMAEAPGEALARLELVCDGPPGWDVTIRAIPDHVEAAVRVGDEARAGRYLPRLDTWARHTESPVARALVLRCEALLSEEPDFEAALAILESGPYDRARTQLSYGEWLRRHRQRTKARGQLTEAYATFGQIGAQGWQGRVRAELVALGDAVPEVETSTQLTPQELQVVRRAALGLSNREIAAQLFLSPRTVGHHLYRAFPKLGISRRAELAQLEL